MGWLYTIHEQALGPRAVASQFPIPESTGNTYPWVHVHCLGVRCRRLCTHRGWEGNVIYLPCTKVKITEEMCTVDATGGGPLWTQGSTVVDSKGGGPLWTHKGRPPSVSAQTARTCRDDALSLTVLPVLPEPWATPCPSLPCALLPLSLESVQRGGAGVDPWAGCIAPPRRMMHSP